jgi:hypothetical protein
MVAVVVCCSGASRGGFYRLGGERKRGHELGAVAGNFPGNGGSGDDVGRRDGSGGTAVPPRALWHRSLTSAMARTRTSVG